MTCLEKVKKERTFPLLERLLCNYDDVFYLIDSSQHPVEADAAVPILQMRK